MAEVRIAPGTPYFGTTHAEGIILQQPHVTLLIGMRKARPSAVRIELCVGRKELGTASAAMEGPFAALGEQAARKRRLGSGFTQNVVPLRTQVRLPLLLGFLYFGANVVSHHTLRTPPRAGRMRMPGGGGTGRRWTAAPLRRAERLPRFSSSINVTAAQGSAPMRAQVVPMKLLFEILLSVFLHPIAMILMWINLISRGDMSDLKKIVWFVVSIIWGLGPILYILVAEGTLW